MIKLANTEHIVFHLKVKKLMKYPKEHLRRANISMRTFRTLREKKTISNYVVTRICLLHLQLKKQKQ